MSCRFLSWSIRTLRSASSFATRERSRVTSAFWTVSSSLCTLISCILSRIASFSSCLRSSSECTSSARVSSCLRSRRSVSLSKFSSTIMFCFAAVTVSSSFSAPVLYNSMSATRCLAVRSSVARVSRRLVATRPSSTSRRSCDLSSFCVSACSARTPFRLSTSACSAVWASASPSSVVPSSLSSLRSSTADWKSCLYKSWPWWTMCRSTLRSFDVRFLSACAQPWISLSRPAFFDRSSWPFWLTAASRSEMAVSCLFTSRVYASSCASWSSSSAACSSAVIADLVLSSTLASNASTSASASSSSLARFEYVSTMASASRTCRRSSCEVRVTTFRRLSSSDWKRSAWAAAASRAPSSWATTRSCLSRAMSASLLAVSP
mmetsp:Transcript_3101/g.7435  ORF Transcript_3101/g.7435 Transcript_3101/m.7435 type:complete len:377 (-) Transcript_3101:1076-2206(-)